MTMKRKTPEDRRTKRRTKVRIGRPPQKLAGEVDERILDAARSVFLERGLAGASIDEIARLARAGKPTIYSRFPTKQDLFVAVSLRDTALIISRFGTHPVTGATLEERLISIATNILERILDSDAIDFMRLSVAEVRRFPDLARARHTARERAAQAVARLLSEATHSDETSLLPAFAPRQLMTTTRFFMDLAVTELFTRALFGEDLKVLRAEIDARVKRSVAFFLAACRHGWTA
jgi:AcrR family transcriptional regulator